MPQLRIIFLILALAAVLFVTSVKFWWAAPALLATAFAVTSMFSNAVISLAYVGSAAFLVVLLGILSRAASQNATVR